jgi:MoxR-like ATPase
MQDFIPSTTEAFDIPAHDHGAWPATRHCFDEDSVWAIRAALATGRPLLLRGEPGIGKSQIARAAAVKLEVPFLAKVIDERTERDDLLCYYDAVARVAAAQVCGLAGEKNNWEDLMKEERFLRPGILWWALNWDKAKEQAGKFCRTCPEPEKPTDKDGIEWHSKSSRLCGPVVLIDEIDKADPSVPNGLLESLGNEGFQTAHMAKPASLEKGAPRPLVIITTNEERELPPAFLRRCLVHTLVFPSDPVPFLCARARVFWKADIIEDTVLEEITKQLLADRAEAVKEGLAIPGAAEFLDLARALAARCPGDPNAQLDCLKQIARFALKKNLPPRG